MKIVALGDIHGNLKMTQQMEDAIKETDLLFLNGDLTDFGPAESINILLEDFRKLTSAPIKAVPGNCDTQEVFLELGRIGINLHRTGEILGEGLGIMAVGGSNSTPFDTPIEFGEFDIAHFLDDAYNQVQLCKGIILFTHFPPKDTNADKIAAGAHVGSKTLRDFILRHPTIKLLVCGHIHEAMGTDKLDGVPVVNHGMASEGHFVTIETGVDEGGQPEISFELH